MHLACHRSSGKVLPRGAAYAGRFVPVVCTAQVRGAESGPEHVAESKHVDEGGLLFATNQGVAKVDGLFHGHNLKATDLSRVLRCVGARHSAR